MYNVIIDVLRDELDSDSLVNLPKDFYINVRLYVKGLRDKIDSSPKDLAEIFGGELDLIIRSISLLFQLRLYKMVRHCLFSDSKIPENLHDEELDAYGKLRETISTILQTAVSSINSPNIITKRILVRFTANVPAFVGVDLMVYGPFEPEDIAYIPLINADTLILKGIAERLG